VAREIAELAYRVPARRKLLGAAAQFEPDFLYERYAFGNTAGINAARELRRPLVLEVNSPMVLELERTRGLYFKRLAQRVERNVLRSADVVCAVSGVLRDILVEEGVEAARILVTPNGVELELYDFEDRPGSRGAARQALGLSQAPSQELVLGFVGYYRTWHRLDLAIECLASLPGVRLVVVGEGPAHAELVALADRRGVRARVHFAGAFPHDSIPALLPAFDIALVPAINPYASPLKLHEYMAARLAVVGPDQPNIRAVLQSGHNAELFLPGDRDALLGAIQRFVSSPQHREDCGAAARATIEERDLTWRGNARRVVAAVEGRPCLEPS
jgi:glycosyltransferase involved in cell wall biosynthesis